MHLASWHQKWQKSNKSYSKSIALIPSQQGKTIWHKKLKRKSLVIFQKNIWIDFRLLRKQSSLAERFSSRIMHRVVIFELQIIYRVIVWYTQIMYRVVWYASKTKAFVVSGMVCCGKLSWSNINVWPQMKEEEEEKKSNYKKYKSMIKLAWSNFSAFQEAGWDVDRRCSTGCTPRLLTSSSCLAWDGRACMELDQMELAEINGGCHTRSGLY